MLCVATVVAFTFYWMSAVIKSFFISRINADVRHIERDTI